MFRRVSVTLLLGSLLSCAAIIPDYNAKKVIDKVDKTPGWTMRMVPSGPFVCEDGIADHYASITFILTLQHQEPKYQWFLLDNGDGARFEPTTGVTLKVKAGRGQHQVNYGLYDPESQTIIDQRVKKYVVGPCPDDGQRRVSNVD